MERLAELRESQALTLRDLAERSGVDANTINQVELGHRKPRPSTLRKLAKALDVEVRELVEEPVPLGEAPLPSPVAAEMEATLLAIRENVEVLERYFNNPPDEATADEAMNRFYDLQPKPLEHLSLMHPDEMRQYIGEVREVYEAQAKINRQLEAWNVAQYSHLHKQHA